MLVPQPPPSDSVAPAVAPRRLLVVDDDADFAESLADILEVHGYAVEIVGSAAEAEAALGDDGPPVVMLDIRLGGTSGVDLLAELAARHPQLICVMMTAHVDTRSAVQALRRGAYDYIDKACDPGELLAVLERAFEKHEFQSGKQQAMAALQQAKEAAESASRAKSGFLATISHELRTPLNAIIGFSELVLAEPLGPIGNEQYKGYIKDVHESGQHLLALINDILDLSKAEAGKLELSEHVVDLRQALGAVCRLVNHRVAEGNLALDIGIAADLPPLRADERKLKQVLLNLLSNAVKFTADGGRIQVIVALDEAGRCRVTVSDTGIGIAAEHLEKVFEPFSQVDSSLSRQHAGTGLGLPLVKALMELHGGTVALESRLGEGTSVTVAFPADRMQPRNGRAASAA
ncbi:ATP-binding response regulator [Desertibaculum subflavum]|uniref:ATP-binding response regulator n=1 Tax=Desertibaculum subflavum TaxID=2268458 RepID=UPI000E675036